MWLLYQRWDSCFACVCFVVLRPRYSFQNMWDFKAIWQEQVQFVSDTLKDKKDRVTGGEFKSPNLHPSVNMGHQHERKNWTWTLDWQNSWYKYFT